MYIVKKCLDGFMQEFDRIYLATPPAFNFFSRSAMIAANRIVVPFDCDTFSKQALYQLIETIKEMKADNNAQLSLEAIIPNQVLSRASLPQSLIDGLKADSHTVSIPTLASSVILRKSHDKAKPSVHLKPEHLPSFEFEALFQELESTC